jgi:histidyl-tRNA synthetase
VARSTGLSGFPEWLPEGRLVELEVLDTVRRVFELHGFTPLETRSVEPVDVLLRKGEIDKEVYAVRRLHADAADDDTLALHFDLTVPFARFVVENAARLDFPLRRYQVQKVWRGERPQEGRFREFTQADIDIVDVDVLASHHDAEMALVMAEVFASMPFLPRATIHVNNRKVLEGFYRGLGIEDVPAVLRAIDKLDKIGAAKVRTLLLEAGLAETAADQVLALAAIRGADGTVAD